MTRAKDMTGARALVCNLDDVIHNDVMVVGVARSNPRQIAKPD